MSPITPELFDTKSYYHPVLEYLLMKEKDFKNNHLNKSLDQLVSSIFLFQLKLGSLAPDHQFLIDFDWLSCAM